MREQREIKFRAWDSERKCWVKAWIMDNALTPQEELPTSIILQQFTGLKDKNGKEIYEGDIVHYVYYVEHGQWGEHKDGGNVIVKWNDTKAGFYPLYEWKEYNEQLSRCEVIGNIWESPALLTP